MRYLADVYEFQLKFGIPQPQIARQLPKELAEFRLKFLKEELEEYEKAVESGDLERQLDALVDLVYVALGTALMSGFDFDTAWSRVQLANMAKERAKSANDSKRGSAYDIVKPAGWRPPELGDLVYPTHIRWNPDDLFNRRY